MARAKDLGPLGVGALGDQGVVTICRIALRAPLHLPVEPAQAEVGLKPTLPQRIVVQEVYGRML